MKMFNRIFFILLALLAVAGPDMTLAQEKAQAAGAEGHYTAPFKHPGMYQSGDDLAYMRTMIERGAEPWKSAFEKLKARATLDYEPKPVAYISVGAYGTNNIGGREFSQGARAAYDHALMWYITGDRRHADKAVEILNAWAYTLRSFDANDAKLSVGLNGSVYLNAAEILRHTDAGWQADQVEQFERFVRTVLYPTIEDFFTEANGNWDGAIINTMMCMGVFLDDHDMFNRAVERYYRGVRNSGIVKYVYPGGQCQETTRDWDHVQLGLGEFAKAAQVADTHGLDFYSVGDDRLAQGFEQCSKYMLDKQDFDLYGVMQHRRDEVFKDVYESIYAHYRNVRGIDLPYTGRVVREVTRPDSSVGVLTTIKAPRGDFKTFAKLEIPAFLKPTETGALLDGPAKAAPADAVVVRPGEPIQPVIDAHKGSGRWIVLSAGVHTLDKPLALYSGITLAGEGRATILHLDGKKGGIAMVNGENTMENVTVRDMIVEGAVNVTENADPNHDRRLRMYMLSAEREGIVLRSGDGGRMKNILFENLTVQNFTKTGVSVSDGEQVTVSRCDFSDNGGSVSPGAGFHHNLGLCYSKDCKVTDSRFDASPWGSGIFVKFCDGVTIRGCETARNRQAGIYCAESSDLRIENNLAEGNECNGVAIAALMDGCRNVILRGNLSQNNTGSGYLLEQVSGLTDSGNRVRHNNKN